MAHRVCKPIAEAGLPRFAPLLPDQQHVKDLAGVVKPLISLEPANPPAWGRVKCRLSPATLDFTKIVPSMSSATLAIPQIRPANSLF